MWGQRNHRRYASEIETAGMNVGVAETNDWLQEIECWATVRKVIKKRQMQLNKRNRENYSQASLDSWNHYLMTVESYWFAPVWGHSGGQSGHMETFHII